MSVRACVRLTAATRVFYVWRGIIGLCINFEASNDIWDNECSSIRTNNKEKSEKKINLEICTLSTSRTHDKN
jgi:hypothetical protein